MTRRALRAFARDVAADLRSHAARLVLSCGVLLAVVALICGDWLFVLANQVGAK